MQVNNVKKAIFIGSVGCGKTTLCQRILDENIEYKKTQTVQFYAKSSLVDTPGEFTDNRRLYSALSVTANDVDLIFLLQSVVEKRQTFAPGFGGMFSKPIIGIVTKIDLAKQQDELTYAKSQLVMAGAQKVIFVSSKENKGINEVKKILQ